MRASFCCIVSIGMRHRGFLYSLSLGGPKWGSEVEARTFTLEEFTCFFCPLGNSVLNDAWRLVRRFAGHLKLEGGMDTGTRIYPLVCLACASSNAMQSMIVVGTPEEARRNL